MARLMFPAPSCIALHQARTRGSSIQLMREPDCYSFSNPRVGSEGTTTPPRVKQSQAASTPTWLSWDSSTRTLFRCRTALSQPCIFSLFRIPMAASTSQTRYHYPLYSLGPDPISITALTLLALKSDGFTSANPTISQALNFLSKSVASNFEENGHVYSAAMSSLAFKAYDQPDNAITSVVYILSQQDNDGGFADSGRSTYPESNALDTGWAVIALETRSSEEGALSPINSPPVAVFSLIPQTPTVGVAIHFDASASLDLDSDQLLFIWTFGDGSGTHGSSSIHTYTEAGNFTVTLTVIDSGTNPGPLSDTTSLTITIQPAPVQKSPTFPTNTTELWILTGAAGAVAIIGAAYYLGRKSARGPVAPTPVTR